MFKDAFQINLQLFAEGDITDMGNGNDSTASGEPDLASLLGNAGQGEDGQVQTQQQVDRTFTQADVDRIVSERLARERQKYQGYDEIQAQLGALQGYGYTLEDVLSHMEQQAYQQQATEYGLTPEMAQKISELEHKVSTFEQVEADRMLESELNRLRSDKDFGEFFTQNEMEILQEALDHQLADIETAMGRVFLRKYPEIRQQLTQTGEQQAIRQIQQRGSTVVDGSSQGGVGDGVQLSNEQLAIAKALGVNPNDYAKRMKKR